LEKSHYLIYREYLPGIRDFLSLHELLKTKPHSLKLKKLALQSKYVLKEYDKNRVSEVSYLGVSGWRIRPKIAKK